MTHTLRRQIINSSNKSTVVLRDGYPYFADNKYVSVLYEGLGILARNYHPKTSLIFTF